MADEVRTRLFGVGEPDSKSVCRGANDGATHVDVAYPYGHFLPARDRARSVECDAAGRDVVDAKQRNVTPRYNPVHIKGAQALAVPALSRFDRDKACKRKNKEI